MNVLYAVALLFASNCFMTYAWYGHLRNPSLSLWAAILTSWGVAFFEYVLQVPANRIGYQTLSGYQLKIMQECITLFVFMGFAWMFLGEGFQLKYGISFLFILAAVAVAFYPS